MKQFITVLFILVCAANIAFCQKPAFKKPGKCNDVELQKLNGNVKTIVQQFWTKPQKINGVWVRTGEASKKTTAFSRTGYIEYEIPETGNKIIYDYEHANGQRFSLDKIQNGVQISHSTFLAGTDTLMEIIINTNTQKKESKTIEIYEPANNERVTVNINNYEYIRMSVDECTYTNTGTKHKYLLQTDEVSTVYYTRTILKKDEKGNPTEIVTETEDSAITYEVAVYTYY